MEAIVSLLAAIQPWHWLVLGLVLLISEMMSGTSYLLWPAVAAFATGLVSFSGATNWVVDVTLFAVLTIALTAFGRPLVQRWRNDGGLRNLNERGQSLIGVRATLTNFADGVGAVKINDTIWRAVSEDALAAGDHVEIAAVDGTTLRVKRA
ncbi:NfeD family protein [Terricaulis sp.]|uniref:NfeD family protein n=1 Tax=Terricaulis sp. TaxID=2768686 RepID=UPI0037847589